MELSTEAYPLPIHSISLYPISTFLTLLHSERPKIVYNFGLSECNRVKLCCVEKSKSLILKGQFGDFGLNHAHMAQPDKESEMKGGHELVNNL